MYKTLLLIIMPLFLFGQKASDKIDQIGISLDALKSDIVLLENQTGQSNEQNHFSLYSFNDYAKKLGSNLIFNSPDSRFHVKNYVPTIALTYDARNGSLINVRFSGVREETITDHNYAKGLIRAYFNNHAYTFDRWGNNKPPHWIYVPKKSN